MRHLAITGDPEKGSAIIGLLEELGAKNTWKYKGNCSSWVYYIHDNEIKAIVRDSIGLNPKFAVFTYDDFTRLYPLKVGDSIQVPGDFDTGTVLSLCWNDCTGDMMYKIQVQGKSAPQGAKGWWYGLHLQPKKDADNNSGYTCTVWGDPTVPGKEKKQIHDFGYAIRALKEGKRVTRRGWNGEGMYLWLKPASTVKAEWCKDPLLKSIAEDNGGKIEALGTICMKTANNKVLTGWLASQSDMLAEDWEIL